MDIKFQITDEKQIAALQEFQKRYNSGQEEKDKIENISEFYKVFTSGWREDLVKQFDISQTTDVGYLKEKLLEDSTTVVQRVKSDALEAQAKQKENESEV